MRWHFVRGFTLVETLVVISLYTIMLTAVTYSIQQLYQQNAYQLAQAEEVDTARSGLTTWVRDAREMTYAEDGSYPLVIASSTRVGFYSDIDRDDLVEYVEYSLSSTTLLKHTYNPYGNPVQYSTTTPDETKILSIFVQNGLQNQTLFSYYNASGTVLANPQSAVSDIRLVRMRLIVNIDPIRAPGEFLLEGSATPRNLKDTL